MVQWVSASPSNGRSQRLVTKCKVARLEYARRSCHEELVIFTAGALSKPFVGRSSEECLIQVPRLLLSVLEPPHFTEVT